METAGRKKKKKEQLRDTLEEASGRNRQRDGSGHAAAIELEGLSQEGGGNGQLWISDGDLGEIGLLEERLRWLCRRSESEDDLWRLILDEEKLLWVRRDIRNERRGNTQAKGYCGYIALWDTWRRQRGLPHSDTLGTRWKDEFGEWLKRMRTWFRPESLPWRVIGLVILQHNLYPGGLLGYELWFNNTWLNNVQIDFQLHMWTGGDGQTAKLTQATDEENVVRAVTELAGRQLDIVGRHDHSVIWDADHFYIVNDPRTITSRRLHDAMREMVRIAWGRVQAGEDGWIGAGTTTEVEVEGAARGPAMEEDEAEDPVIGLAWEGNDERRPKKRKDGEDGGDTAPASEE
jgi:hypothetical protein